MQYIMRLIFQLYMMQSTLYTCNANPEYHKLKNILSLRLSALVLAKQLPNLVTDMKILTPMCELAVDIHYLDMFILKYDGRKSRHYISEQCIGLVRIFIHCWSQGFHFRTKILGNHSLTSVVNQISFS